MYTLTFSYKNRNTVINENISILRTINNIVMVGDLLQ